MIADKNMKILIVDDFKTMVKLTVGLLSQMGFKNVDEAVNGEEALKKLKENKYGLVLSDWNMQPMTGLDLLKAIRADADLKTLPVILITAESKPENIITALQAGVNSYIVKPFNANTLKDRLAAVIGAF